MKLNVKHGDHCKKLFLTKQYATVLNNIPTVYKANTNITENEPWLIHKIAERMSSEFWGNIQREGHMSERPKYDSEVYKLAILI